MRFAFTEEQEMFRDTVRDLFGDLCPPEAVRATWTSQDGRVPGLWSALGDMGVLAMLAPESSGGLGMNEVDLVQILEEAGYAGVPEPLVEHVAVAVPALAEASSPHLAAAISGASRCTIRLRGDQPDAASERPVVGASGADLVVVEGPDGLVAATQWTATETTSIDQSRRLSTGLEVVASDPLAGADAARAYDRAVLGTAAQCVGVARRLLDATVDYVGDRHQFGKPVGSYQAVKHHLANVRLGIEFATPLVYRSAWSVAHPESHDPVVRGRDVSMAKATAGDAVDKACRVALQCHGAIGYTFEYDLQLWLKRGWALAAAYGDARQHRDRVADALGL